jgi:4-hydroxybenzoate polyprenyltransferase
MIISALELYHSGQIIASRLAAISCAIISLITLLLRLNYFMDIFVGVAVGHLLYRLCRKHQPFIEAYILSPILKQSKIP